MRLLFTDTTPCWCRSSSCRTSTMAEANLNGAALFDVAGKSKDPREGPERTLGSGARQGHRGDGPAGCSATFPPTARNLSSADAGRLRSARRALRPRDGVPRGASASGALALPLRLAATGRTLSQPEEKIPSSYFLTFSIMLFSSHAQRHDFLTIRCVRWARVAWP